MPDPKIPPGTAELASLDAVIAELERTRADARRELAGAHGTTAEALAVALKRLEDKLSEAHRAREKLSERMGRAARVQVALTELKAVTGELQSLAQAGDRGARFEELRSRGLALQAEIAEARAGVRKP